jgi:uncharacterized protein (TIGR03066 family)
MKSKTRKAKQTPSPQAKPPKPSDGNAGTRRKWIIMVAAAVVVAAALFAVFEFLLPDRIPPELVGRWQVVEGDWAGMTLEFKRNGAMTGRPLGAQDRLVEGHASVEGKLLWTTTTNPFTGREETGTQKILTLTGTELVTEDSKGTRITMKRIN